ncbi:MAG TPA: DNA replication and repair protein RecF [Ktedonobacter sp.]|jgi:DNA replication and repair protein RecF|nr:DNA replication and repair protein RecF [Ktedonobacter sp.]
MFLSHLALNEFRNYKHLDLSLGRGLFLYYGENAQGKTNLLEAIGMLATGSSFHAASDREVVNWSAPDHITHLKAHVKRREDDVELEMVVFDPTPPVLEGVNPPHGNVALPANTQRKRVKINTIPKKVIDLIGQMKVVLFAPTDLNLVDGSPEERRRFLDRALCQVQPRYCQALVQYRKIIAQRSALLKRIRDNQEDPRLLEYLDEKLTTLANVIMFERLRMLSSLNQQTNVLQETLSGGREQLHIVYRPSFKVDAAWNTVESQQHYLAQLREMRKRELIQGVCLLGPHRDDLEFLVNGVNMLTYGSRGQQRTTALSAKLAELAYMRASTGDEPVLLLDDVFSELDTQRRGHLLREVMRHEQVFLTATDLSSFPEEILSQAHIYEVVNGEVRETGR